MDILYELWLHSICGFEPDKAAAAAFLFEDSGNALHSGDVDKKRAKEMGISDRIVNEIDNPEHFRAAGDIMRFCEREHIRIITQESKEYPERLKNVYMPPRILFARGQKLDIDNVLTLSVVGCRKPSPQGKEAAMRIAAELARHGAVVVGGMAEGIDTAAHWSVLNNKGRTVAVLAGGVDSIFPESNRKLYYELIEKGTVISERPPKSKGKGYYYRQRNRIIVGLSHGTIIVEGKESSGSAMYAGIVAENNRDLFAVPGNPVIWQSSLPNSLINDGAVMVNEFDVPVKHYMETRPELIHEPEKEVSAKSDTARGSAVFTESETKILNFIGDNGGTASMEEITQACDIPVNRLGSSLTMLAVRGILRAESGNRYVLCENKK